MNAPEWLVEEAATKLAKEPEITPARYEFDRYHGHEQSLGQKKLTVS